MSKRAYSHQYIENVVTTISAVHHEPPPHRFDWDLLDRSRTPAWIDALRQAEQRLREMRQRLEHLDAPGRGCETCGAAITGRADRRYCSATCRQRAHRRSQVEP